FNDVGIAGRARPILVVYRPGVETNKTSRASHSKGEGSFMKSSRVLLAFIAAAMAGTMVLAIRAADDPNKSPQKTGAQVKEELSLQEQILRDQFQQFQTSILKLKQRLERSGAREDLERAKTLDRILEQVRNDGITVQFDKLVESINK